MEEDDQTIVIQEKDTIYSKFCPVCKKGFNSGKAVGGHMRIHVQPKKKVNHQPIKSKKILREDEEISESGYYVKKKHHIKKLSCLLCGKKFLSVKSLCGHMRCHPERNWRGIQPPKIAKNRSSSKIEPKNIDNQIDSVTDADGNNQTSDSTESFRDFSVSSKRGTSSEDDRLYDAVLDLMMLAHGNSFESGQVVESAAATNSNSLTFKSETGDTNKISESKIPSEGRGSTNLSNHFIDDAEKGEIGSFLRKSVSVEEHGHEYCERTDTKTTIKNKKRKKRVRLSDLESEKCVDPVTTNPSQHKYRCITCGKCFETHQALGGHRSSHNKNKNVIYNSIDQSSFAASEDERHSAGIVQVDYESPEIAKKCRKILDFDLNEVPPLENEAGIESELGANFDYGSSS